LAVEGPFEFKLTVEADVTSLTVPADFLQPDIFYSIERFWRSKRAGTRPSP